MTLFSIKPTRVVVFTSVQRRRRLTPEQKLEIVKQTNEAGISPSLATRKHGLPADLLYQWRKVFLEGSLVAVGANETVVLASNFQEAMRRIERSSSPFARESEVEFFPMEEVLHETVKIYR